MAQSTLAGVITAIGTVFTALGLLVTAISGLIRSRKVEAKVDVVHKIVNQQRTDMQNYNRALINALQKHNIEVPTDQSLPPDASVKADHE